tara:strand:+ start:937 stop:1224 length:288 start_codon:yes stop_codon:yes gene_type:complete
MPTATAAKKTTTTSRKRRTRKVSATAPKSAPLNTTPSTEIMEEVKAEAPKVETKVTTKTWIERAKELDGFSLIVLPLLFLEGFTKEILKVTGVTV